MPYLVEADLTEAELAWLDQQVLSGRYESRAAAIAELLRRGLEASDQRDDDSSGSAN